MTLKIIGGDTKDLGSVVNQVNQNIAHLKGDARTRISKDDTGTRRVLLGRGKDNFYGLKVSKDGKDVYEATDDELIFNSDQNIFKIVGKGTVTVNIDGVNTVSTASIPHNLGYTPIPIGFLGDATISSIGSGLNMPLPTWTSAAIDTTNGVVSFGTWLFCATDDTHFHAQLLDSTQTAQSYDVSYYLLSPNNLDN